MEIVSRTADAMVVADTRPHRVYSQYQFRNPEKAIIDFCSEVRSEAAIQFALKPLLTNGAYSWGHQLLGFPLIGEYWTGKGIKVGVIDSGISKQVKELQPAGGTNTIDGADPDAWNVDEEGHGTHVAGIIGGRGQVTGGAPDAELYSIKVFPGGHLSDLVSSRGTEHRWPRPSSPLWSLSS